MSSAQSPWSRVSKGKPCPICAKPDACKVSPDGTVCMCKRIEPGSFKESKGWYFHRLIDSPSPTRPAPAKQRKAATATSSYPDPQAAIEAVSRQCGGTFVSGWSYFNRDWSEVMRVLRFDLGDGEKAYRPIHPTKSGWKIGDPPGLLSLYRLDALPDTGTIYDVEGEKAADAGAKIGLNTTTSAHGAGAPEKTDWTPLAGRDVVILPDNDEAGDKYGQSVTKILLKLDPPARVRIVTLPGLPAGGDIVEYLAVGGTREDIERLAAEAPLIDPTSVIGGPVVTCMSDVATKVIAWLWHLRIALGRITLLVGRPGEGKSFLGFYIAARVSMGTPWPDGSPCERGSVLLVCPEDDAGDTIRARLDALGADCTKIHLMTMVRRINEDGKPMDRMFTLHDLPALEQAMKSIPDLRLVIIDPLGSVLGGSTDAYRDNEVRGVLAPLALAMERHNAAGLIVAHRRKGAGLNADEMSLGSIGIVGQARTVWHLMRDREDRDRRLLLPGKNNLVAEGTGMAFTISGEPPQLHWENEPVTISADDAMAMEGGRPGRPDHERSEAADWLASELADLQEHPVETLKLDATAAGLAWRTVQRAATELQVIRHRRGFGGGFVWRLSRPAKLDVDDPAPMRANHSCQTPMFHTSGTNGTNGKTNGNGGPSKLIVHSCHNPIYIRGGRANEVADGRQRGRI